MSKQCIICERETNKPLRDFFLHFWLIDFQEWNMEIFKGNCSVFGFWIGMRANLTLLCPLLNTLINWRHRKKRLIFPEGFQCQMRNNNEKI